MKSRREFFKVFGAGLAALAVEQEFGLAKKAVSYFLAPAGGWQGCTSLFNIEYHQVNATSGTWLGLDRRRIPRLFEVPTILDQIDRRTQAQRNLDEIVEGMRRGLDEAFLAT